MATQRDMLFETGQAAHESHYSNPEDEWETHESHESHYSNPEDEWETHETHESHYSNPEDEWENHESHYSNPEDEWESNESHYSNPEWEDEADPFFGKAFKMLGKIAKPLLRAAAPLAKKLAPMAAQTLAGMIPGVGGIAGPLAGKLVGALVREGEAEAAALEAHLLSPEAVMESGSAAAHEAALSELLAAEAAEASSMAEAEAAIAASLPLTITIMGGRRALGRVTPVLTRANARLVQVLGSKGPAGRQLLRAVPEINRVGVGMLKAQARRNQPITSSSAVRAMAAATQRVLSNPQRVQRVLSRNAAIRQRRAAVFTPARATPSNPRRDGLRRCRCGAPIR